MYTAIFSNLEIDVKKRRTKARREFNKAPLFAYDILSKLYPSYCYEEFLNDVSVKRKKKTPVSQQWAQYGRYGKIQNLVAKYSLTGGARYIKAARKLRKEIAHPYKVVATTPCGFMEFIFSAMTPLKDIEKLIKKINHCKTSAKVLKVVADFECVRAMV